MEGELFIQYRRSIMQLRLLLQTFISIDSKIEQLIQKLEAMSTESIIIEIFQEFQKEKFSERSTNSILNQRKRTNKSVIQTKLVSLPPVYPG